ncbi:MAG: hypothetical protein AAGJ80_20425, partial [Cyanobacteria bacterium J06553_1]
QDFNQKLQILIENRSLRKTMGDHARNSVQQYGWEQAIQNLVEIWQQAINKQLTVNSQLLTEDTQQLASLQR